MVALFALALSACVGEDSALTEPCASGCNESSMVGSTCTEGTDCFTGASCNTAFPNGYCQIECASNASSGDSCAGTGVCLASAETPAPVCLAGCDPTNPASCGRQDSVCYVIGGTSSGVCHLKCASDNDCGQGLSCDGAGLCRTQGAACDSLTDSGCDAGLQCFGSRATGTFCGLPGAGRLNEPCSSLAACEAGLVCGSGNCRTRCSTSGLVDCGDFNSCTPLLPEQNLGYCD